MTVYVINQLVNKSLLNSLKEYLRVDKITVCYSDIYNYFTCKTYPEIYNQDKKSMVNRFLWDKLNSLHIEDVINCPKVENKRRV